jgi:DNA-binding SARP family transcriptional activator
LEGFLARNRARRTQLPVHPVIRRAWVDRAELAALLWPERPAKLAFTSLRKALHRLELRPLTAVVETQGNALRFDADTDVQAFEKALRKD